MSDFDYYIQSDEDVMVSNIDDYELYLIEKGEDIDQSEVDHVDINTFSEEDLLF